MAERSIRSGYYNGTWDGGPGVGLDEFQEARAAAQEEIAEAALYGRAVRPILVNGRRWVYSPPASIHQGDTMGIPVIRLTVERMEANILLALSRHELKISEEIERAVKAYCQPENIQRIVDEAVSRTLDSTIKDEVDKFYRHGSGRERIRRAVISTLEEA